MAESPEYTTPGAVLAGKYRVEGVLGRGGMGVVVAALHLQLQERVALKFLLERSEQNPLPLARFLREAQAAARIKSEHVARVLDFGALEDGTPFLVMEYLEGRDLARELSERGPLSIERAVDTLLQACEALAEAHALGIVHRDLKPANLFLAINGAGRARVKLLDFGISKVTEAVTGPNVTTTHALLGSPAYMSPEQLRRPREVDARSDIWSLGAVLFELVTGETPFHGETLSDLCVKIATEPPRRLRELLPQAPPRLEAVLQRCLEKERARRYPTIAALAEDLSALGSAEGRASLARIASWAGAPLATAATLGAPRAEEPGSMRTLTAATGNARAITPNPRETVAPASGRRAKLAGFVALAALAGAGGWLLVHTAASRASVPEPRVSEPELRALPTAPSGAAPHPSGAASNKELAGTEASLQADVTEPPVVTFKAERSEPSTRPPVPPAPTVRARRSSSASPAPSVKPALPHVAPKAAGGSVFDTRKL